MLITKLETQSTVKERKRVAAYCRVSTDTDAQLESLDNQMEAFRYRLAQHPEWELVSIYTDEGLSGTSVKGRKQFKQMIEDCKAGMIDYIMTKSISRFARNTLDCIGYVRELQSYGVQLYFEKEGIDTGDATSEMLLTIMASFAQEESRSISENVKWGLRKRFEAGREIRVPLYGYYHTDEKSFQIKEDEAAIVREIFDRYVHGDYLTTIMKDMIKRGVKPPAGDSWKRLQMDRLIKNEKYVGDNVLQKTYVENHLNHKQIRNNGEVPQYRITDAHPAIIDRHTFERAQKILRLRKERKSCGSYPYGEMLRCPHCGKVLMHGRMSGFSYKGMPLGIDGWGCYGEEGCRHYLLLQSVLDDAMIRAYEEKYGERKERVDFYWIDDTIKAIELGEDKVMVRWLDGSRTVVAMERDGWPYKGKAYSRNYNHFLYRVKAGEEEKLIKNLMGLEGTIEDEEPVNLEEPDRLDFSHAFDSMWK